MHVTLLIYSIVMLYVLHCTLFNYWYCIIINSINTYSINF